MSVCVSHEWIFFLYETVVFFYEIGLDLIVSAYILHDVQLFADIVSRPRGASNLRASHCDNERPLPIYTARYTKNHADAVHNADDTRRILLRTFVAQLVAATKICPQPSQNAPAKTHNKHGFKWHRR